MVEGSNKAKLFQKVAKVMAKVERVPKKGYNSFHKYEYVMESDLVDHVRKFMVEEGLVLFPSLKEYEIKGDIAVCQFEFTLCDTETGESITTIQPAEGQDKGDKKFYKAQTGALKYFLMKTFLIPSGDDPEQDDAPNAQKQGNAPRKSNPGPNTNQNKIPTWKAIMNAEDRLVELTGNEKSNVRGELEKRFGKLGKYKEMKEETAALVLGQLDKWIDSYSNPQA